MLEVIQFIDENILLFVQEFLRSGFLNAPMTFFSAIGNYGLVWIVVCAVFVCFKKTRKAGIAGFAALLFCYLVGDVILKPLIGRVRPSEAIGSLTVLVKDQTRYCFPSGHACAAFGVSAALRRVLPKYTGGLFFILSLLIAVSRVYVGAHYLTDVIAGILFGMIIGNVAGAAIKGTIKNPRSSAD